MVTNRQLSQSCEELSSLERRVKLPHAFLCSFMGTAAFSTFNISQLQGCTFQTPARVPVGPYFAFGASKARFLPSGDKQLEEKVGWRQSFQHRLGKTSHTCITPGGASAALAIWMQHHLFTLSQINSAKGFAKGEHMAAKTGSVEKSSTQPKHFEEKTLILCIHTYS